MLHPTAVYFLPRRIEHGAMQAQVLDGSDRAGAPSDALCRLATLQQDIVDAVERLLETMSLPFDGDERRRAVQRACDLLGKRAPRLLEVEEQHVFVALMESMAGSDPVCLRELAAALADERRRLTQGWGALRANVLEQLGEREASPRDSAELTDFAAAWRAHLARWHSELLPMAERLLDDAALDGIDRALDAIAIEPGTAEGDPPRATAEGDSPRAVTVTEPPAS